MSKANRKGISRIDQPSKHTHGWYVRVRVSEKIHSKFFPDHRLGSKGKALKAAETYRDQLLRMQAKSSNGKKPAAKPKAKPEKKGNWIQLDPAVAAAFPNQAAVNKTLRQVLTLATDIRKKK